MKKPCNLKGLPKNEVKGSIAKTLDKKAIKITALSIKKGFLILEKGMLFVEILASPIIISIMQAILIKMTFGSSYPFGREE